MKWLKGPLLGSAFVFLSCCTNGCNGGSGALVSPPPLIALQQVFTSLPAFSQPLALLQAPGDSSRWFVVQQNGVVYYFTNTAGVSARSTFIDLSPSGANLVDSSESETGLLGMAFHPNFPATPEVFLSYTATGFESRLSRFSSMNGGTTLDDTTEEVLLTRDQPYDNHNGGNIVFGPDGFLYLGLGDGGSASDPDGNGQNTANMLGTILRIDVDNTDDTCTLPYDIPPGNPLSAGCPAGEDDPRLIYVWGLRNPWRFSFDLEAPMGAPDPALWVADVGQNQWEEVNLVEVGGNYGWGCFEGLHVYAPNASEPECTGIVDPIAPLTEYSHSEGISISGGYVYRGDAVEDIQGVYLYSDFGSGNVWGLFNPYGATPTAQRLLSSTGLNVSTFGQDNAGELYLVDYGDGTIFQIVPPAE